MHNIYGCTQECHCSAFQAFLSQFRGTAITFSQNICTIILFFLFLLWLKETYVCVGSFYASVRHGFSIRFLKLILYAVTFYQILKLMETKIYYVLTWVILRSRFFHFSLTNLLHLFLSLSSLMHDWLKPIMKLLKKWLSCTSILITFPHPHPHPPKKGCIPFC